MATYTNVSVYLGEISTSGKTPTMTYSASEINTAISNSGIPSDCTVTKAIIKFMGAKSLSLPTGRSSITMTLGSYSKTHSEVIGNEGSNNDFSSYDDECTSDDIKGYIGSNGRFSNDLSFYMSKSSSSSTYWRITATIYFDYETHEHSYTSTVTTAATCTSTGVRTYTCSCGASYTETISALGHSYTDTVIAPTTTESGYTLHTCSRCGNSYKDNYTAIITGVASPSEGGTVSGGGTYNHGDKVSIAASENEGYEFVQWSDGNIYPLRSITVSASETYTAIFEKIKYTVTLNEPTGGTVTGLSVGDNTIEHGTNITLTAVPDSGYEFAFFRILFGDDGVAPSLAGDYPASPIVFTVTENFALIAFFDEVSQQVYQGNTLAQAYRGNSIVAVYVGNTKI